MAPLDRRHDYGGRRMAATRETVGDYLAGGVITKLPDGKFDQDACRAGVLRHLQERRNTIAKGMQLLAKNMQDGQQALNGLHQSIEAEKWEWKEVKAKPSVKAA